MKSEVPYCPNGKPIQGGIILGVVNENHEVEFTPEPVKIDQEFMDTVIDAGLEANFRFSHPCVKGKCGHWTGHRCNVPDVAFELMKEKMAADGVLPDCSIRSNCRWFSQEGAKACYVCPDMVNYSNEKINLDDIRLEWGKDYEGNAPV
jgi:hypothetical protein